MAVTVANTYDTGDRSDGFGAGGAGAQLTLPFSITAGNQLVMFVACNESTGASLDITDSLAQTWNTHTPGDAGGYGDGRTFLFDVTVTSNDASLDIDLGIDTSINRFYQVTVFELTPSEYQAWDGSAGAPFSGTTALGTSAGAGSDGALGLAWVSSTFDSGTIALTTPSGATSLADSGNSFARSHATEALDTSDTFTPTGTLTGGLQSWSGGWAIFEETAPPGVTGTVAVTLDAFTSSALGSVGDVSGTVAATLDPFTSTATGVVQVTGTATPTLAAFTSTATGFVDTDWAFEDGFSTFDTARWSSSRWRSGGGDSDPGHVIIANDVNGHDNLLPPNDIFVESGALWIGGGSQNYGDTMVRCNQPFEFGDGGVIEMETLLPAHDRLHGWSQFVVTDIPMNGPSALSDNSQGPVPRYGFGVRLNGALCVYSGGFRNSPEVLVWDEWAETIIDNTGNCADISEVVPTLVRVEFDHDHIDIYADSVLWYSEDWTLPPELTSGYLMLGAHNHASMKYRAIASYNAHFDNVRFDGAIETPWLTSRVPDATTSHTHSTGDLAGMAGVDIGYNIPTGTLTLPSVPAGPITARLVLSAQADVISNPDPEDWLLEYSLNGNTVHGVPFLPVPSSSRSGSASFSFEVDVTELVTGSNTVAFTADGFDAAGFTPYLGNVELLVQQADFIGTAAVTLDAFTSTASGSSTTGDAAITLDAFTSTATGTFTVTGTSATTLDEFTSTASGTHTISGTAAVTLDAFTSAADGSSVTGTSAQTLADFTSDASGTANPPGVAGSAAVTLDDFTSTATGTVTTSGSVAVTLDDFTSTATGTFTGAVTGTSATVLDDFTATATGSSTVGSGAVTLDDFTCAASGETSAEAVTGTVAVALDEFTAAATGLALVTGTSATTLDPFTSQAYEIVINPVAYATAVTVTGARGTIAATLGSRGTVTPTHGGP